MDVVFELLQSLRRRAVRLHPKRRTNPASPNKSDLFRRHCYVRRPTLRRGVKPAVCRRHRFAAPLASRTRINFFKRFRLPPDEALARRLVHLNRPVRVAKAVVRRRSSSPRPRTSCPRRLSERPKSICQVQVNPGPHGPALGPNGHRASAVDLRAARLAATGAKRNRVSAAPADAPPPRVGSRPHRSFFFISSPGCVRNRGHPTTSAPGSCFVTATNAESDSTDTIRCCLRCCRFLLRRLKAGRRRPTVMPTDFRGN